MCVWTFVGVDRERTGRKVSRREKLAARSNTATFRGDLAGMAIDAESHLYYR